MRNKINDTIETVGTTCFAGRGARVSDEILLSNVMVKDAVSVKNKKTEIKAVPENNADIKPVKVKPDRVNLKLGKVRVQITSAKRVKVEKDGENALIIYLDII